MLGLQLLTAAALADPCARVSRETAERASRLFHPGVVWAEYCEACGDRRPTQHRVKEVAAIVDQGRDEFQLRVDGALVDLAYVYVQLRPGAPRLFNVANQVGCPTNGVRRTITIPGAGAAPR